MSGNEKRALEVLNKIVAIDETFFPAFIERSKIYLSAMQYNLAEESACHAFTNSYSHIEALRVVTLVQYLHNYDETQHLANLGQIVTLLDQEAHSSLTFCLETAKLFSRVCSNDGKTLEFTFGLVSKTCDLELDSYESSIEKARQLRCLGRYDEAISQYQFAANIDQSNTDALQGMILCQVLSGAMEEARQQLEFLDLVQDDAR